mmetsp:Transcript_13881/g.43040  ORF Transcript_13881/g.43040 Transcript_13881/m.43040 type:complete len:83 (-) Transcript_13881:502-750(-)
MEGMYMYSRIGGPDLHEAAWDGRVDDARLILDRGGADVNVDGWHEDGRTRYRTPLSIACEHGHVDAAALLLDRGAAIDRAAK